METSKRKQFKDQKPLLILLAQTCKHKGNPVVRIQSKYCYPTVNPVSSNVQTPKQKEKDRGNSENTHNPRVQMGLIGSPKSLHCANIDSDSILSSSDLHNVKSFLW